MSPSDIREWLIHSLQVNAEIEAPDEREPTAAPTLRREWHPILGQDDQSTDTVVDVITEEELLRGMERLAREESTNSGTGGL
jgi:DNA-directed RNA polymerase subunit omega